MSQDNTSLASAISLPEAPATVLLPAQALDALLLEVRDLRAIAREHETRLDLHSKRIDDLRFKEEEGAPVPQPRQKDRGEVLLALLAANKGKMLAKDARHKLEISEAAFSLLLKNHSDRIVSKPYFDDRRKHTIELK